MNASGLVEFASHTYDLHHIEKSRKGADRKPGESLEDYTRVLTDDLQRNQDAIAAAIGKPPQVFAWPYGAYPADKSADPILKAVGIRASFTSYQHTSELRRGDADSLFGLGRYLRTPQFDIAENCRKRGLMRFSRVFTKFSKVYAFIFLAFLLE